MAGFALVGIVVLPRAPGSPRWLGTMHEWTFTLALFSGSIIGGLWFCFRVRRFCSLRDDGVRCIRCGYCLRGIESARCPECGTSIADPGRKDDGL